MSNRADPSLEMLIQKLKRVDQIFEKMNENVTVMLNDGIMEMKNFKTQVLSAYFLKRKLYLNMLSF